MYEHQPAVRTVIDYIARNVAQLGLKLYERKSSTWTGNTTRTIPPA